MLEDFPGILCQYMSKFMKTASNLGQTFAALENARGFRRKGLGQRTQVPGYKLIPSWSSRA